MSVLAVMAARNEAGYIQATLRAVIDEGIEVILLDNGSVDGTRELAESFLGHGLLEIRDVPWTGTFDLTQQLLAKRSLYASSRHDWLMHVDADEWHRSVLDMPFDRFLMDEVGARYQVVNFREYVFLPPIGGDMWGNDFRRLATRYYLFEPRPRRLLRAWRRGFDVDGVGTGGHGSRTVDAEVVYPVDQVLRHYIGLSWSHAISKRADRSYPPGELAHGWHGNRLDMSAARPIDTHPALRVAEPWDVRHLDDSQPCTNQFWEPGFTVGA